MRKLVLGVLLAGLCGCNTRDEMPDAGDGDGDVDVDSDSDGDGDPTLEEVCAARDSCVEAGDPRSGPCMETLGALANSTDAACGLCLLCLSEVSCEGWRESPNGPLDCEDSCVPCEAAWESGLGEFWDTCASDVDCAYGHFCVEDPGFCQRFCTAGTQCNLAVCANDHLCWVACGDTRCDPEVVCFDVATAMGTLSSCGGGE